jgi:hypothetical protein
VSFLLVVRRPESWSVERGMTSLSDTTVVASVAAGLMVHSSVATGKPSVELRQTADSSMAAILGRVAASTGQKVSWEFLTKESTLDLLPKNIALDASLPTPQHAVPGRTKLVEPAASGRSVTSRSCPAESTSCR